MIFRYFFYVLICIQCSLGTGISAQNLTVFLVEEGPAHTRYLHSPHTDHGFTTVSLQNGNFSTGLHEITYSGVSGFAVSPDNRFIAVLKRGENNSYHVNVLNSDGSVYMEHKDVIILDPNDHSNRIFAHNDGSFTIRDNIAGFTLFNPGGEETARLFNSSGSMMGEAVSELRQSRSGRQVAVFNPRIVRQNRDQSRIQLIEDNELREFRTLDGTLAGLKISDVAGRYITLVDGTSGGILSVLNPNGELLRQMDVMNNPEHLFVGRDMRHAIVTRQNRVELYNVRSGERIVNTVARSRVHFAHFDEDKHILILLAGSNSSADGEIRNPIIYAIDTDARSIKSQELARSIFMDHKKLEIELHPDGDRSWLLLGLNSPVRISL